MIVGIGQVLRGDDGVGPVICSRLRGRIGADLIDAGPAPENFIGTIARLEPDNLLVVDAVESGGSPGSIVVLRPYGLKTNSISTHSACLDLFLSLIARHVRGRILLIGIQPQQLGIGQPMSDAVRNAVEKLVEVLTTLLPCRRAY